MNNKDHYYCNASCQDCGCDCDCHIGKLRADNARLQGELYMISSQARIAEQQNGQLVHEAEQRKVDNARLREALKGLRKDYSGACWCYELHCFGYHEEACEAVQKALKETKP